jgi:hypothetical protein
VLYMIATVLYMIANVLYITATVLYMIARSVTRNMKGVVRVSNVVTLSFLSKSALFSRSRATAI